MSKLYLRSPNRLRHWLIVGLAFILTLALAAPVLAQTPPDPPKPSAPRNVSVTATLNDDDPPVNVSGRLTVTWQRPTDDAGQSTLSYVVEWWNLRASGGPDWVTTDVAVVMDRSTTIANLADGRHYVVRVRASYVSGSDTILGPPVEGSGTPRGVPAEAELPAVVTGLRLTAGYQTITAIWTGSASGDEPINYRVQWLDDLSGTSWQNAGVGAVEDDATAGDFKVLISNLRVGEEYRVQVTAYNGAGDGPAAVGDITTILVAVAPDGPAAPLLERQGQGTALAVSWEEPAGNGLPVTGYQVQYREIAEPVNTYAGWPAESTVILGRSALITGLDVDEDYEVQVQARNQSGDNGADAWSEFSTAASTAASPMEEQTQEPQPSTKTKTVTVTKTVYRTRSAPAAAPAPVGPSIIGDSGYATTYLAVDGNSVELRIHPQAGGPASHSYAIGSYIRDADLGQTYQIVAGGKRRWVSPGSPLVYAIPWAVVNSQHTYPTLVVAAIPLDESAPSDGFLVRGQNGRIVSFDVGMWRHVPNIPTFQALGYRWCDVNAADAGFFSRIREGAAHPATSQPAQANYPSCG